MGYIDPSDIERVIDAVSIVDVVEDYVKLSRRGANYVGLCPFHDEKTPSFSVSETKRMYKCFGCGKGGNVVSFVMEAEHLSFPEALRVLAKRANVQLQEQEETPEQRAQKTERDRLLELVAWAQSWFNRSLMQHAQGRAIGLSYFKERGLAPETIRTFGLGYALDMPTALTGDALQAGFSADLLVKAGLTVEREGHRYDRFRGRVIFPIQSSSGRTIGFGGRALHLGERTAKYVNSPESDIYRKGTTLYGIAQAKAEIIKRDRSILVEGYLDVLQLHQLGVRNVVASSGTSLTLEQTHMLYRFSRNVTVLYDGDRAGIKAALRGLDILLAEGFAVRVALLPDGQDPDDYAKGHTLEEVEAFLTNGAEDIIEFKIRILLSEHGDDPTKRAAAVSDIVRSIALIPDQLLRAAYVQRAAQLTGMGERALLAELARQLTVPPRGARGDLPRSPRANPALPPPRVGWSGALEVFERALMAILLRHGGAPYSDGLHPDYDGESAPLRVVDYVRRELDRDTLHLQTPLLRELYNRYLQMSDDERDDFVRTLQKDDNYRLLEEAIELWTSYELNRSLGEATERGTGCGLSRRWKELGEENDVTADDIAGEAYRSVHVYKRQVLDLRREAIKARLDEVQDSNQAAALLRELNELNLMYCSYYRVTKGLVMTERLVPGGRPSVERRKRDGGS